jgi:hypothetical protein
MLALLLAMCWCKPIRVVVLAPASSHEEYMTQWSSLLLDLEQAAGTTEEGPFIRVGRFESSVGAKPPAASAAIFGAKTSRTGWREKSRRR